jgi:Protein of unknown function (DUF3102)
MKTQARDLAEIADDIRSRIVGDAIAIGGLLREAKLQLRRGKFLPWVESEFEFSIRTAQNYMKAHRLATKYATVAYSKLTPTALYTLADGYFNAGDKFSADEVGLVLNEAAEQRVTRARVWEIICDEQHRKAALARGFNSVAEADAADAAEAEAANAAEAEAEVKAEEAARAELEATLAAGSELPPPEPTPQTSSLDQAILDATHADRGELRPGHGSMTERLVELTEEEIHKEIVRAVKALGFEDVKIGGGTTSVKPHESGGDQVITTYWVMTREIEPRLSSDARAKLRLLRERKAA